MEAVKESPLPGEASSYSPDVDLGATTLTYLFSDLEGSTRLWERHPDAMHDALARHDAILRDAVQAAGGTVVKTTGDGLMAVFEDPVVAVSASVEASAACATRHGE